LQASIALAALAIALAGCTEKLVNPPPPVVLAVPDSIQQIFTDHCASCHNGVGTSLPGIQDLSTAVKSYAMIVDVPSIERSQFKRIAPGDSLNSYIVMKLRNKAGIGGAPMPAGAYPMDPVLVMRIANWAQQGAAPTTSAAGRRQLLAGR
jgi:hypothetical protein